MSDLRGCLACLIRLHWDLLWICYFGFVWGWGISHTFIKPSPPSPRFFFLGRCFLGRRFPGDRFLGRRFLDTPSEARHLAARFLARSRLLDRGEDTKEKGTRNVGGAEKGKRKRPDYLGAWNTLWGFIILSLEKRACFPRASQGQCDFLFAINMTFAA